MPRICPQNELCILWSSEGKIAVGNAQCQQPQISELLSISLPWSKSTLYLPSLRLFVMLFPALFVPEREILLDGCKVFTKKKIIKFYMKSFALNGISENFSSSVLKFNVHKNLDLNAWTFEKKMPFLHQSPRVPCYGSVSVKLLHPFSLHPKTLHRQPVCLLSLHL